MYVINLFGGPGTGKSTTAAAVFAELKIRGFNAEMHREFVKGPVWDGYHTMLADQVYILGQQYHEMMRYQRGGVHVVVTDSPLLLSCIYGEMEGYFFSNYVRQLHRRFQNANVLLRRVKPYNPSGRLQDEAQAREFDEKNERMLAQHLDLGPTARVAADDKAAAEIIRWWETQQ